jgi:hypothetical protein
VPSSTPPLPTLPSLNSSEPNTCPNEFGGDSLHRELSDLGIVVAHVATKYLMMTLQVFGAAAELTSPIVSA